MSKNSNAKRKRAKKRQARKEQQRQQHKKRSQSRARAIAKAANTVIGYLAMNKSDPRILVCTGPAAFLTPTQQMLEDLLSELELELADWRIIPVTLFELTEALELGAPYCIHRQVRTHIDSLLGLPKVNEELFNGPWIIMDGWNVVPPDKYPSPPLLESPEWR